MYSTLDTKQYMMSDYAFETAEQNEKERIEWLEMEKDFIKTLAGFYTKKCTDNHEEAREQQERDYERESRIVESQLHNQYA